MACSRAFAINARRSPAGGGPRQDVEDAGANRLGGGVRPRRIRDADDDRLGMLGADRPRDPQRLAVLPKIDQAQRHRVGEVAQGVAAVNVDR